MAMRKSFAAAASALVLLFSAAAGAQSPDSIRETWRGPDASSLAGILKGTEKNQHAGGTAKPRVEVLRFKPAGDSGVAKSLADALGRSVEERAALAAAFLQIKQAYETEVAKEGKSNDLAAAMTFFISANVAAYHRTDTPTDAATESLYKSLQETMAAAPGFARMSDAEKQRTHDWLVCMGGFVLAGYADAQQGGDAGALKTFGELADYSVRLVLGVEVGKLSFVGNSLSTGVSAGAPAQTAAAGNKVVGTWSISASSPAGGSMGTNAGYYKGQYRFAADGTYSFKSERWYGYSRSKEFYTTEESGTYSVSGDSLTVSPAASRTILRSPEGAVQKTQNNQLEKVTYRWQLHHFEGINETQLVLQPPRETTRDGGFSSSSLFPNSYLYSPNANLEWRF
jgi:hypothetical protein